MPTSVGLDAHIEPCRYKKERRAKCPPSLLFVREPPKPAARVSGNPGALSPLDVSVNPKKSFDFLRTPAKYAYRGEITKSTGVSLTLTLCLLFPRKSFL